MDGRSVGPLPLRRVLHACLVHSERLLQPARVHAYAQSRSLMTGLFQSRLLFAKALVLCRSVRERRHPGIAGPLDAGRQIERARDRSRRIFAQRFPAP
jgi:hypothetical protein